ncbi:hypothetical protein [Mesoterricola silvestris]|uniref:Uncharacterized protein n=1 Tax=Mesoterricola silvestris TaxID=2927979 RepID=A0AA48GID4_9BACT|nr:hypothetical protein [Mesoterricola silvestris]BDU73496.1 hypothetical protein METEAL_26700 [Mesoterricola silvestris]
MLRRILTSVAGAAAQLALLAALAAGGIRDGLGFWILVAALLVCTLAVAWTRRPYDRARLGFLLAHLGPALLLAGLWGPAWAVIPGLACLAIGIPWMFWIKPLLKARKDKAAPPAWERLTLQGTRVLFLASGAGLALPALRREAPAPWLLASWLVLAVALHLHHVKALKGPRAQAAGLVSWALCLAAFLALR